MKKTFSYKKYLLFKKRYFLLALIILFSEILIALYAHDRFIRPWFGDFLVVILIYCFLKSFIKIPVLPAAIGVLLFSYGIEVLQYFRLVNRLHLQHSTIARVIIGTTFQWTDLLAYTVGIGVVLLIEMYYRENK